MQTCFPLSRAIAILASWLLLPLLSACTGAQLPADAFTRGSVVGMTGAMVCLDLNQNARCDADEPSAVADADGNFVLPGTGTVAAQGWVTAPGNAAPSAGMAAMPVVLRAPAGATAVVSPISTEWLALMELDGSSLAAARHRLAARIGVPDAALLGRPEQAADARVRATLRAETAQLIPRIAAAVAEAKTGAAPNRPGAADLPRSLRNHLALDAIETLVVIYAENRAFDTLYGLFPGANGIPGRNPSSQGGYRSQIDFDGSVLPVLPPTWGGMTASGQAVTLTQAQSSGMPNQPFQIDDPQGVNGSGVVLSQSVITRDLVHRFYSNMMQIDGGRNDRFAAYSDAGGLSMGYYDGSAMKLWALAQHYTLADNFFMGAFGGSFLNHQYLICACAPTYPNADAADSPAKDSISQIELDPQGRFTRFIPAKSMPDSVLSGAPRHQRDGTLTPKDASGMFHAINTMQPLYQPSGNAPAAGGDARYADAQKATTLPAQTQTTIGDTLSAKGVRWAWYAGSWSAASAGTPEARRLIYGGAAQFQPHHQPFNYYARFDPAAHAADRVAHLKDFDTDFLADAAAGRLPAVSFYKPQGDLNEHPGYASVAAGDAHIADVIARLQQSPQWPHLLIVVTYDENGGFYDHAAVPVGDRWGPGTRVPALIISPYAKKGHVDKTPYDTGSILRFITHRWSLAPLPGVLMRDESLLQNGQAPMGDLSAALDFGR